MVMNSGKFGRCHNCGGPVPFGCVISINPACYRCQQEGHSDNVCKLCNDKLQVAFDKVKKAVEKAESTTTEMENCPFCGCKGVFWYKDDTNSLGCSNPFCICFTLTREFDTKEEAIQAWNKRVK